MRPSRWEGEAIDMVEMLTRRLRILVKANDREWDEITRETIREAMDFLRRYDEREEGER
jgi:hypothetical protein